MTSRRTALSVCLSLAATTFASTLTLLALHGTPADARGAAAAPMLGTEDFRRAHPKGGVLKPGERVRRVWGSRMATGQTPSESATNFFSQWSGLWQVPMSQLTPGGPFKDGAHVISIPSAAGTRRGADLSAVYFTQTVAGIPVFRAYGWAVTTDAADFPVMYAGGTLRPVGDLAERLEAAPPSPSSLAGSAFASQVRSVIAGETKISAPQFVIWAGIDDDIKPARLGVLFHAESANPDAPGFSAYEIIADPATGDILHSESLVCNAVVTGTVTGNITNGVRADICDTEASFPLPYIGVSVGSNTVYANAAGQFATANLAVATKIEPKPALGRYFQLTTKTGTLISVTGQTKVTGTADFAFNPTPSESTTAQTNAYYHANIARDFVLTASPSYPTIPTQTTFAVNVNLAETCNAYYYNSSINFFKSGGGCNNSAFSGVVHHEYGHHVVQMGGSGQGAYGEGFGDIMSLLINDDPELGVGFFTGSCASGGMRSADNTCVYSAMGCSSCGSEIHDCGQLLSGVVWDLREGMGDRYGSAEGLSMTADIAINQVLLHVGQSDIGFDIRTDYTILDDDDADLSNGSPNSDLIDAACCAHQLYYSLPKPQTLTASSGLYTTKVELAWTAVGEAEQYTIYRGTAGTPAVDPIAVVVAPDTTYTDTTGTPGVLYVYSVVAGTATCPGFEAATASGWRSLTTPGNVAATDGTFNDRVRVTWDAVGGATRYAVYRRQGTQTALRVGLTSATRFDDRTARPGVIYAYTVRAVAAPGESASSLPNNGWRYNTAGSNPATPGGGDSSGSSLRASDEGGLSRPSQGATAGAGASRPSDRGAAKLPEPSGDPLMQRIASSDPARQLDCETATAEQMADAIRAGSVDSNGDGQPDLCQRTRGDIDLSGHVDSGDIVMLMLVMGEEDPTVGDLTQDGVIDRDDLERLQDLVTDQEIRDEIEAGLEAPVISIEKPASR